jgi:hypothetical protein
MNATRATRPASAAPAPLVLAVLGLGLACSSATGTHTLPPSTGLVSLCVSATPVEDWQEIDLKVLAVTLTPQDGGKDVALLDTRGRGLPVNLAGRAGLSTFLGNLPVPVGTYRGATLTLATADRDVALYTASSPSPGFPGTGQDRDWEVPSSFIHVQGATAAGTLARAIPFAAPLAVTTERSAVLDLAFDPGRPSFLTSAVWPGRGWVSWTVDLDGALRQRPVTEAAQLPLVPVNGAVYGLSADRRAFLLSPLISAGLLPGYAPLVTVPVRLDATRGTAFHDLALGTLTVLRDLSGIGDALPGRTVRVAGRLQADGSLMADRIWAAGSGVVYPTDLDGVVTAVDPVAGLVVGDGMVGSGNGMTRGSWAYANAATIFTVPEAGPDPVGTGPAFLADLGLARGFQVHTVQYLPPTSAEKPTLVSVAIDGARYRGAITRADGAGLDLACPSGGAAADLAVTLPYLAAGTPNGNDPSGNPVSGFTWWVGAHPAQLNQGAGARASFAQAAGATVDFGGSVGVVRARASVRAAWGDASKPAGWSARSATLEPLVLPAATAATAWAPGPGGGSFALAVEGGTGAVVVDAATSGDAPTLFYQADAPGPGFTGGDPALHLTAIDPSTSAGQATLVRLLVAGAAVRVFGIPQPTGHLLAGTLLLLTFRS